MKILPILILLTIAALGQAQAQTYGTNIGFTYYDLQSHNSAGSRIAKLPDGRIISTWAESCIDDPAPCPGCPFAKLGAGYNSSAANGDYFDQWSLEEDGTCDQADRDFGVFNSRVEHPEVAALADGTELIIAGSPLTGIKRNPAGTGTWMPLPAIPAGVTNARPRIAATFNTIHMIASCQPCTSSAGVISPIAYYRSQDGGNTWDIADQLLPGLDTINFPDPIQPHGYAIHARGQNVAIVAGSGKNSWSLWKSDNGGTSFTQTILRQFTITDTTNIGSATHAGYPTNDGYLEVLIDNAGITHTWAGYILGHVRKDTIPLLFDGFNPMQSAGLWYWNNGNMAGTAPTLIVSGLVDKYLAGHPKDFIADGSIAGTGPDNPYNAGMVSMPTAAVDADNCLFLIYSAVEEGTSNSGLPTGQPFRELYIMMKPGNSSTWQGPFNLALYLGHYDNSTEYEEEVYPNLVKDVAADKVLHLMFQHDDEPGLRVQGDFDQSLKNQILYTPVPLGSIIFCDFTGTHQEPSAISKLSIVPNPTTGKTNVKVELLKDAKVGVKVMNLLGHEVFSKQAADFFVNNNSSNIIELDMSAQPAGMYLVSVIVDGIAQTERLVKQ